MKPADLSAWREKMRLTQEEAASLLGYSRTHYVKMESGHSEGKKAFESPQLALACAAIYRGIEPWPECR